jgi:hypothetical protein
MGLSHQRGKSREAGGSWWTRVWRSRRIAEASAPGAAGRRLVDKLIAGPHVYICDRCSPQRARCAPTPRAPLRTSSSRHGEVQLHRKRANAERPVVMVPMGHVCVDCLRTCREIADGRAA